VNLGLAVAMSLLGTNLPGEVIGKVALAFGQALPGRYEVCEVDGVPVVLDGGHNAAGVLAALAAVRRAYPRRHLSVVFGVLREKDAAGMLSGFAGEAHAIVLTRPENERASDPVRIGREHDPRDLGGRRARVAPDPVEALGVALEAVKGVDGVVLLTGSLSTVAPVLRWLRET
jgi:dihydrofolate synthase/folylpolyglutamate synthase